MKETQGHSFLCEILEGASVILRRYFGRSLEMKTKADRSIVTNADLASETYLIDKIKKYYPEDCILSEEQGWLNHPSRAGQRVWVIDPLDGTTNFFHRYPHFAISVACAYFTKNAKIVSVFGGIAEPMQNNFYFAEKDQGAFLNNQPLRILPPTSFKKSFLVTGHYYPDHPDYEEVNRFREISLRCQNIRRTGSAALDLAYLAKGVFHGYWEIGLKPWDIAAGYLLVQESKGKVLNYCSSPEIPFDIEGEGIIAGDPSTVETLSGILSKQET